MGGGQSAPCQGVVLAPDFVALFRFCVELDSQLFHLAERKTAFHSTAAVPSKTIRVAKILVVSDK